LVYDFIAVTDGGGSASISPLNRDPVRMDTLRNVLNPEYWSIGKGGYKDGIYSVIQWTKEGLISYGEKKKGGY